MTKKVTSQKVGLKASSNLKVLNDICLIEEDPIDYEVDKPSGLSKEVVDMIRQGILFIPQVAEFYAKKYPCTGKLIASGPKCKNAIPLGSRVLFARQGGVRDKINGKDYVIIRECDIHAILDRS